MYRIPTYIYPVARLLYSCLKSHKLFKNILNPAALGYSQTKRWITYLTDEQPSGLLTAHCLDESLLDESRISG